MPKPTQEDVLWVNGSAPPTTSADLSVAQTSVPRPISQYRSYSIDSAWTGSPNGALDLQVANAPASSDAMGMLASGSAIWVSVSYALVVMGPTPNAASSPSSQGEAGNSHQWVRLVWTPQAGSSGNLRSSFGGVTK